MNQPDKSVLLISQLFPPISNVGALRTAFFSKYLPEFGWHPIILTTDSHPSHLLADIDFPGLPPDDDIFRVSGAEEETGKDMISKLKRLPYKVLAPDLSGLRKFYKRMFSTLKDIYNANKIEVIYASSGPGAVLHIAAKAHKTFEIPWIADFRDILEQWQPNRWIDRLQWTRLKKRQFQFTSSAKSLITVSEGLADQLYFRLKRRPIVIPNGYDDVDYGHFGPFESPYFTITYTGRIYYRSHPGPEMLFEALDRAIFKGQIRGRDLKVVFLGTEKSIIHDLKDKYLCGQQIDILPRVSNAKSLLAQKKSTVLLHFGHQPTKGIVTAKIFEYLGARRPIISIPGNDDSVNTILKQTNSGACCGSVESIHHTLSQWYKQWKDTGAVDYHGKNDKIRKYSRKSQTGRLAQILDEAIIK